MKTIISLVLFTTVLLERTSGSNEYGFIIATILVNILLWMPRD